MKTFLLFILFLISCSTSVEPIKKAKEDFHCLDGFKNQEVIINTDSTSPMIVGVQEVKVSGMGPEQDFQVRVFQNKKQLESIFSTDSHNLGEDQLSKKGLVWVASISIENRIFDISANIKPESFYLELKGDYKPEDKVVKQMTRFNLLELKKLSEKSSSVKALIHISIKEYQDDGSLTDLNLAIPQGLPFNLVNYSPDISDQICW